MTLDRFFGYTDAWIGIHIQLHVVVSLGIALLGSVYYYVWCIYLPRRSRYVLVREYVIQEDGVSRNVFQKVHLE